MQSQYSGKLKDNIFLKGHLPFPENPDKNQLNSIDVNGCF
jgi:hypothetical protein